MSKFRKLVVTLTGLAAAAPAYAQAIAPPDAPLAIVPLAQRLTLLGIFAHAKPVVQLLIAGLVVAIGYAAFVYIRGLVGRRDLRVGGQGFLFALAGGGPLIGLFGAAYGMLDSFIGVANVRPTPSLSILAPGLAAALLCVCLGLLAGAAGIIGLSGRAQAIAHATPASADAPPAHLARAIA